MRPITFVLPLILVAACKDDPKPSVSQTATESFTQVPATSADILWVVDNSISMQEEQFKVMDGASLFVDTFERVGVDFHLGVVTTDVTAAANQAGVLQGETPYLTDLDEDYVEQFQERVDVGIAGDDMESGLEAAVLALSEPNASGVNAGFLRDDARLSIIIVSDEEDCSDFGTLLSEDQNVNQGGDCYTNLDGLTPVADIVLALQALKPDPSQVQLSGIVGGDDRYCPTSQPGTRYIEASDSVGGIVGNICINDYQRIMGDLGLVAAGMKVEFELSQVPVLASIEAWTHPETGGDYEVLEDDENGWTYSDDPPTLTFHGDGVPDRGATLTVTYEY